MRIENGYLQQGVLCGKKDNRNVVGNFFDVMNKTRESIIIRLAQGIHM